MCGYGFCCGLTGFCLLGDMVGDSCMLLLDLNVDKLRGGCVKFCREVA